MYPKSVPDTLSAPHAVDQREYGTQKSRAEELRARRNETSMYQYLLTQYGYRDRLQQMLQRKIQEEGEQARITKDYPGMSNQRPNPQ
jgi:hypothetical protein